MLTSELPEPHRVLQPSSTHTPPSVLTQEVLPLPCIALSFDKQEGRAMNQAERQIFYKLLIDLFLNSQGKHLQLTSKQSEAQMRILKPMPEAEVNQYVRPTLRVDKPAANYARRSNPYAKNKDKDKSQSTEMLTDDLMKWK